MTKSPENLFTAAQSQEKQGNWEEAAELYRDALAERPDFIEAHHNLALALRHLEQPTDALRHAESAAHMLPDHPTIQFSLGVSLEQTGQIENAITAYRKSTELRPNYVAALNNLGRLLEASGYLPESLDYLERAIALAPTDRGVNLNLANSYLQSGQPAKSEHILSTLLIEDDADALAHNSLGVTVHVLGEHRRAIDHFRRAIAHTPEFAEAHENLAQALLFEEEYEEAWQEYEWRWLNDSNTQSKRQFPTPTWQGDDLNGQTLLVHAEQGFGDVIQFVRFLPLLNKFGGRLIFACAAPLLALFSEFDSVDQIVDINDDLPAFDVHIPLLSLPRLFGINGTNIPKTPYIRRKPAEIGSNSAKLKIGFAWAGRPRHEFDPHRNRTSPIEAWRSLLEIPEIDLFSLQTGPKAAELARINKSEAIIDLETKISSFNDTANLISGMDLVITVDTALAHLAGAIGKNVWILLATCADWRWQTDSVKNPWYGTARLFRQKTPGNWSDPLDEVKHQLIGLIP